VRSSRMPDRGWLVWSQNAWYQATLLRRLPTPCHRVLDVGCGAGAFAVRLADHAGEVIAVDRSPAMVAAARARVPPNVTVVEDDVMRMALPDAGFDAIVSIAALHHLPLEPALSKLAGALRPGGVLAAVALPRVDLPRDLPVEVVSMAGQVAIGAARRAAANATWARRLDPASDVEGMPIAMPNLTTAEVRRRAAGVLPGVRVRRLPFWRYLLEWHRPG
jgi:SAM-dependent methyltransferase